MNTIDHTSATIWRVLAEHEITKYAPALSVVDLADKIVAVIDRDASTDAQVRTHPLYREQVRRTQDAQRRAARERDRLKRRLEQVEEERDRARDLVADLVAIGERGTEREERTGPIEEEPTDLGGVIVAASRDHMSDGMCMWVNAVTDTYPWLCAEHGRWCTWSDLTAPRWATARERATGKVDPEQDEAETEPTGWEPGTDVTDRLAEAPECVIVQDRDGDYWHSNFDRWFFWLGADTGWGTAPASLTTFVDLAPVTVATAEQLRAAGILAGSDQPQDEEEN